MTLHEKLIEIKRDAEIERKQNKIILNQDIIMERLNSLFNQIEKLDKKINISLKRLLLKNQDGFIYQK